MLIHYYFWPRFLPFLTRRFSPQKSESGFISLISMPETTDELPSFHIWFLEAPAGD